MDQLPKNFKLATNLALAAGILGVLSGLAGAAGILSGGDRMSQMFAMKQRREAAQEVQDRMMKESAELSDAWRIPNGLIALGNMGLSAALIAGAVGANKMRRSGRRLLTRMLLVMAIFEPLASGVALVVMWKTIALQKRFMPELMRASTGGSSQVGDIASSVMIWSLYFSLVMIVSWLGAKVFFYVWARGRLLKPDIDELFAQHGT